MCLFTSTMSQIMKKKKDLPHAYFGINIYPQQEKILFYCLIKYHIKKPKTANKKYLNQCHVMPLYYINY